MNINHFANDGVKTDTKINKIIQNVFIKRLMNHFIKIMKIH